MTLGSKYLSVVHLIESCLEKTLKEYRFAAQIVRGPGRSSALSQSPIVEQAAPGKVQGSGGVKCSPGNPAASLGG